MANKYWLGAADDVNQVDTITATGTWAADDTATITCNNKTVTVTLGSSFATTDVVEALANAINAIDATSDLANDETRNRGGRELGEFRDMLASASGSVLTLTSATAGVPFTVTRSETTAGSGALGAVTSVTAATGRNWFDNAANWEGGAVPSIADTIIYSDGNVGVLHGLDNTTADLSISRANEYAGNIGLLPTNTTHSGFPYHEYRQLKLDTPITSTTGDIIHLLGDRASEITPSGITHIDLGTSTGNSLQVIVNDAAALTTAGRAVEIAGGKELLLVVHRGSVSVGKELAETASEIKDLKTYYKTVQATDANVLIGVNATWDSNVTGHDQSGGQVHLKVGHASLYTEVHGGTLTLDDSIDFGTVDIYAGIVKPVQANITKLRLHSGATLDCRGSSECDIGQTIFFDGFIYYDPEGIATHTNGIDFYGCAPADGTFVVRRHRTWTKSDLVY